MSPRRHALVYLIPYLAQHRGSLCLGSLMVLMTVATSMLAPWVLKYVVDDLQRSPTLERLPLYGSFIVGISLVEGFFRFWMRRILIGVSRRIEYDLRNQFLERIQQMSLAWVSRQKTGDIMSRATNDLNAVRSVLGPGIMYSLTTAITVVIATVILSNLNLKLTVLAYIPLVILSVLVKTFGTRIHERFERIQEQFSDLNTHVQQNLSGIRVVKAFAQEESQVATFERLNQEYVHRNFRLIRVWGAFYPLISGLIGLSFVALLWFGGQEVISGRLSLGELVAFMGYLAMLTWPTIAVGWVINIFQRGAASMDRMLPILEATPDIKNGFRSCTPEPGAARITIRNLTFSYAPSDRAALRNIDLTVAPGETVAVVGATGSGKSTLLNLLPRLYDPPPGTIFIDDIDVRDWDLSDLRRNIGYVPQETFLFSDTLGANIAFGRAAEPSVSELDSVARTSRIKREILAFDQKYDTRVGERGITLSGGQKQRITISRALLISPRLLILDDALSSVDTETEDHILHQLASSKTNRTTVLVSHRVSTVKSAHQILVLHEGAIVERGDHASLLALGGIYASLHQKQLLEQELGEV